MKRVRAKSQAEVNEAPAGTAAGAGKPPVHRGRPKGFDVDYALDQALQVFWKNGYEGTSLPDLTRAMGINRPSLYATFGNKEQLFRKVMDRYAAGPAAYACKALHEPTSREVVQRLLAGAVQTLSNPANPPGCLAVQGALTCSAEADSVRQALADQRQAGEQAIRVRFERAVAEGDLPCDAVPADLARYVATVMHGLSIQATGGAGREELSRVAELVLRAWPGR